MKNTLLIFFVVISISSFAQRVDWVDYGVVNNLSPFANAVATDPSGFIYSLHRYNGSVILQGDTIPAASAQDDCILIKYDSTGQVIWSKPFGGNWFDDVYKVAADGAGHVYVSCLVQTSTEMSDTVYPCLTQYQVIQFDSGGHFLRTKFITGLGTTALAALGDYVYLAHENVVEKLDTSLNTIWSRTATVGSLTFYSTGDLYVTPGGRLIASGLEGNGGTVTFDTITFNFTPGGFDEVFVISMDTSGNASWGRALYPTSGATETTFGAAGDDAGNVYMTMRTTNQMIFANDTLENPYSAAQPYNAVVRYDATGQEIWARALYPVQNSDIFDVMVNAQGDILLAGSYILGGAQFGSFTLPPSGGAIVLKLDSGGTSLWAKHDVQTLPASKHFKGLAPLGNGYAAVGFYGSNFQLDCFDAGNANPGFFTTYLTENPVLDASFAYTVPSAFTIHFTDQSTGAISWHWDFGDGDTSDQANPVHNYASAGNYTVTLTATDGICTDTFSVQFVNVGIPASLAIPEFNLYPNPGKTELWLDGSGPGLVTVLTPHGQEVFRQEYTIAPFLIRTENFAPGVYFVRVETRGYTLTRRWTKPE